MDDLNSKLSELLSSADGLNKLRDVANMLGIPADDTPSPQHTEGQGDMLQSLLAGLTGGAAGSGGGMPGLDVGAIMKIRDVLGSSAGDPNVVFLQSLKPILSRERQGRVDEAVRIMKLLGLLPLLQDGTLQGLLGMLGGDL